MKIAMDPQWWSRPRRRRKDALPQIEHGDTVYEAVELLEIFSLSFCTSRQGHTSPRVVWRIARCGLMERVKKLPQTDRGRRKILRWGEQRILAEKPGYD